MWGRAAGAGAARPGQLSVEYCTCTVYSDANIQCGGGGGELYGTIWGLQEFVMRYGAGFRIGRI